MKTTLNRIRSFSPCSSSWKKLLKHLNKTEADDEPLSIKTVYESNGFDDALWCLRAVEGHDREIRLFAVWCARQVQHLMTDERSKAALDVAEIYANGGAATEELEAAADAAATYAAYAATRAAYATRAATYADAAAAAARAAATDAATDAAAYAAAYATRAATAYAYAAYAADADAAAADAAAAAARLEMRRKQEEKFIELIK